MTAARAYRAHRNGRVIHVAADSVLESMVAESGAYDLVDEEGTELEELKDGAGDGPAAPAGEEPNTSPAGEPATVPAATLPPVPPAAPPAPAVDVDPAAAALLAAAYAVDTAEGVNSYLDEHPYAAELVLEHERANKARKGILEGRHAAPSAE